MKLLFHSPLRQLVSLLPGAVLSLLLLASCKDTLVEAPKSLAAETFYNTASEVEAATNAIYAALRLDGAMKSLYPIQQETYSELIFGRGSYGPLNDHTGLDNTNVTRVGQMWDAFYLAIRNANLVIENAPKGTSLTTADKNRYVAEARFLRAYTYFQLVRNWGPVPLRTEANMLEPNIKRSPVEPIYQLIQEDLAFAETNLPDKAAQSGRPTRWSAKTLLADVLLQLGKYADVVTKTDEVIKSGRYSLFQVKTSEDFLGLYGPDVVTTPEEVWYLKFSRANNEGWTMVMFAHHPGARYHGAGGFFGHYTDPTLNKSVAAWDDKDLRKAYNLYNWNIGLGTTSYLNRKYRDPIATNQNGAANDFPVYRYADVLMMYAEASARVANGPTAATLEALNQVRRRAYGLPSGTPSAVDYKLADYPNLPSFMDALIKERGWETMYEAKRWLELKRLGIAKQYIKAAEGKDVADKFLLWPIPVSELNYNTALDPTKDQNPGY
ncbi:RagB/SusD family nutrient uptake outer membrane protein [Larkinella soli]|uniref:RagB/SusD family nutrient uptake outer membrane protein n=1 Tax=Larkinella soli TaxID=1770527 RepID=UPI000FFB980D|nr:RagB/SusD family nutrient uptake outer membrane protein [Larkinella soli]